MQKQKKRIITLFVALVLITSCKNEVKKENKRIVRNIKCIEQPVEKEKIILTEAESNFLKRLIKEDIGKQKYDRLNITKSPYSVHYPIDGDPYSVSFSILYKSDFNKDGIIDYVVDRSSEGLLGGNANTNAIYSYYIMKDEINEKEKHSIVGYAPFSYNIIENIDFVGDKLKTDITQNFRTYSTDDLESASLSFLYKNGNVYEESYLSDCKLSKLKSKTIFTNIPEVEKRTRSIDMHNYTETIEEIYKKNDTIITANLSGCDNLSLSFDTSYKVGNDKINDNEFKHSTALQLLNFLSKSTQFSKEIDVVSNYFKDNAINDEYIEKIKGYKFRVLIQKNDEDKNELRFLVQIGRIDNPYQIENWEITTRQKKAVNEN